MAMLLDIKKLQDLRPNQRIKLSNERTNWPQIRVNLMKINSKVIVEHLHSFQEHNVTLRLHPIKGRRH